MEEKNHIYPIFDRMMTRQDKEELLGQHSVMIWFTGLSGSGKSTIAIALERELHKRGLLCRILDGDNIRSGINNNLGFSETDRVENIRRIAEVSKLFLDSGIITIAAFISPNNDIREMAANIIGKDDFLEVFVSTPLEECEKRERIVCEGTERGNSEFYRNFRTFRGSRTSGFVTGYFQIDFGGVGEPFVGACFAKSEVYKMK